MSDMNHGSPSSRSGLVAAALGIVTFTLLFLQSPRADAVCGKQCREAKQFCSTWSKQHPGQHCGTVRGAACTGSSWKKIKQVNAAWAACRQVKGAADRERAQSRCREYEANTAGTCEVHSPLCKAGWVKLGAYGKFRACRRRAPSGSLLFDSYKAFMRKWEGRAGYRMPRPLQTYVSRHYDIDTSKVRWGEPGNKHAACTTDCYNIYCDKGSVISAMEEGQLSRLALHELGHVEQCVRQGGRKKYALLWFRNLPVGFFKALGGDIKDEFKGRIHDRMPMESAAEAKAQRVHDAYRAGFYHKQWKCRLYRDDEIVWESARGHFRVDCEAPAHPAHRQALQAFQQDKAAGHKGKYEFVFGKRTGTHGVIWTKQVGR